MFTGCIRPAAAIYGPYGDIHADFYLGRLMIPSCYGGVLTNFIYVENVSLAQLCYKTRLLESDTLGGDAFCITDAGPPITCNGL
jgi:hypothetical protein